MTFDDWFAAQDFDDEATEYSSEEIARMAWKEAYKEANEEAATYVQNMLLNKQGTLLATGIRLLAEE